MYPFCYHRPKTLADALSAFGEAGSAAYLSGGHTLLPAMKARLAAPDALIDLRHIPELKGIRVNTDEVIICGGATHDEVANSAEVKKVIPALAGLAGSIGDMHVRHMGTIGGSVANNDPAADYPSAVLALAATICTDRREISADDYFTGLYSTVREDDEIITHLRFPIPELAAYAKFRNPASRYAMAAAFVARHRDGAVRVAVTGAGDDGVYRWSEAEEALCGTFSAEALQDLAAGAEGMMSDMHATAEYRAHLVTVMTRRAVASMGHALIFP